MPNKMLSRYFESQRLFGDLDFADLKEAKPNELFDARLELPEEQRNAMEAGFREILEIS